MVSAMPSIPVITQAAPYWKVKLSPDLIHALEKFILAASSGTSFSVSM